MAFALLSPKLIELSQTLMILAYKIIQKL